MPISSAAQEIFLQSKQKLRVKTDQVFVYLMIIQWLAGITAALVISPRTWIGNQDLVNINVYAAIYFGGILALIPIILVLIRPGSKLARYTIAVSQILFSALLIHLTGGRIETHFHVFGSLAFLSFYRDWKVLVIATLVTAVDHWFREFYYPQSVFGVAVVSQWRWLEHAGWVVFEDIFLFKLIHDGLKEMKLNANREADLRIHSQITEAKVQEKTEEYKKLIEQIKINETRMNLALNAANIGSWSWDVKADLISSDIRMGPLFGLEEGKFPPKYHQFANLLHPEDRDYVAQHISKSVNNEELYDVKYRILYPDSSVHVIAAKGFAYRDQNGEVESLIGICMDITKDSEAQKQLETMNKNLIKAEGQIKSIFNSAADAIITINEYGQVLSLNNAAIDIFGYQADELLNKNIKKLMPSPYNEEHDQYINNYLNSGIETAIGTRREVTGKKKDGTLFPIEISVSEVEGQGEKIFSGIIRDITERKVNEAKLAEQASQLQKSNYELDQFAYIASHDLKEPLRGIYTYANFLKADYSKNLDAEANEMLDTIAALCEKLTKLISSLLEFSRLGRVDFAYKETNLQGAVDEVLSSLKIYLDENQAEVIIKDELPTVFCDSVRIGEVFYNLITNAVKYNKSAHKQVTIGTKLSSEHGQVFYVQDNGIGIDPKHFNDAFQIFRKLNPSSQFAEGTGVGLTLVKKIVERHNGQIWIESELGQGTTFFFTLGDSNE